MYARLKGEHPSTWIKVPINNRRSLRFEKSWFVYDDAFYPLLKENKWLEFRSAPVEHKVVTDESTMTEEKTTTKTNKKKKGR